MAQGDFDDTLNFLGHLCWSLGVYARANTFSLADVLSMLLDLFVSQGGSSFKTVPCCLMLCNVTP